MPHSAKHDHFLRTLAWSVAGLIAAALALVLLLDPYGLYGWLRQPGLNVKKPGLTRYQEQIKPVLAIAVQPRTVILGNSRAEIGFDPASPHFAPASQPVFNLAVPGTGLRTAVAELDKLHAAGVRPASIVVGMEFMDFLEPQGSAAPVPAAADPALWRFDVLFSLASLKDALRTVRIQRDEEAVTMSALGFNPSMEYRGFARSDGYEALFRQAARNVQGSLKRKTPGQLSASDFAMLAKLLERAAASGAEVKLLVYPYHAQYLAMIEQAGAWPLFEAWKAGLVAETAKVRAARPQARIAVIDFSGFGEMACESIPGAAERSKSTRWYWEGGHFKSELGEQVLAALAAPGSGFGVPLEAGTLAANAQRIGAERARCAASYPALFSAVQAQWQQQH